MKKYILLIVMLLPGLLATAKEKADEVRNYQIEGVAPPSNGHALVKVTLFNKKKDKVTDDMLANAAVHAILFRGYSESASQAMGKSSSHPALCSSPTVEGQFADFFTNFFDKGGYRSYVEVVGDSRKVVKSGKEYKVSAVVKVNTTALNDRLTKENIKGGLNSGW